MLHGQPLRHVSFRSFDLDNKTKESCSTLGFEPVSLYDTSPPNVRPYFLVDPRSVVNSLRTHIDVLSSCTAKISSSEVAFQGNPTVTRRRKNPRVNVRLGLGTAGLRIGWNLGEVGPCWAANWGIVIGSLAVFHRI